MKAAILYGQNDIRYEDINSPVISENEILVKVKMTGICGSDISRVLGTSAHHYPIVLGHEFSGQVVEIGKDVDNVKVGDRIAGAPLLPCHKCIDCLRGFYSQCRNYSFIGSRIFGSWAEFVKLPSRNAVKLSDDITYEQGALFEPATVALHGLLTMNFTGGTDVAILGMGTIGLFTLQWVKILGAKRIFAFDIDEWKLNVAKEYGADFCLNTGSYAFDEIVQEKTTRRGFDIVIETAGVQFTEKLSLEVVANKGKVMFIGTPSKPITLLPREFEHINRKELTVRGSWMSYSAPFPGREWELAAYYFQKGNIRTDGIIDKIIHMKDIKSVFNDIKTFGKLKGKVLLAAR